MHVYCSVSLFSPAPKAGLDPFGLDVPLEGHLDMRVFFSGVSVSVVTAESCNLEFQMLEWRRLIRRRSRFDLKKKKPLCNRLQFRLEEVIIRLLHFIFVSLLPPQLKL